MGVASILRIALLLLTWPLHSVRRRASAERVAQVGGATALDLRRRALGPRLLIEGDGDER